MIDLDPSDIRHVHLIAICGTGMGSLAGMLKARGLHVTGSDQNVYPPMSDQLNALGIRIMEGYSAGHLEPKPDLVVIGNVISKGNPESDAVIARGIPYTSMAGALRLFFFQNKKTLALCGTHGKTTSTAMLAWLCREAGLSPTYLVGGVMENTQASYHVGQGDLAIVEGDEYDTAWFDKVPKFVRYQPDLALLGNIEFDHADIYPDFDAVKGAFRELVAGLPANGLLVAGIDCPNVREIIRSASCEVRTFSLSWEADFTARVTRIEPGDMEFNIIVDQKDRGRFATKLTGRYNLLNALGIFVLAERIGLSDRQIRDGLDSFLGVKRRQQTLGEVGGILVIDDFAHHPTAVRVTLDGVKEIRPQRRLVAVFEPRTNTSRRSFFQKSYSQSFDAADVAIVCEVYAKGGKIPTDKLDVEELVHEIASSGKNAFYAADYAELLSILKNVLLEGDQVVFLSNGSFGDLPRQTMNLLKASENKK